MKCHKCGFDNLDEANFCIKCGARLDQKIPCPKCGEYISNDEEKLYIHDEISFYEIWTNKEALVKAEGKGIKSRPNLIPGLPLNNIRTYKDKIYMNKTIRYGDYIITTSREGNEDYFLELEII